MKNVLENTVKTLKTSLIEEVLKRCTTLLEIFLENLNKKKEKLLQKVKTKQIYGNNMLKNYTMIQIRLKNWKRRGDYPEELGSPVTKSEFEREINELK